MLAEVWEAAEGLDVVELDQGIGRPVRCFLLKYGGEWVLVDTGYPSTSGDLEKVVGRRSISTILLTHLHLDHSGGLVSLESLRSRRLMYHEKEWLALEQVLATESLVRGLFQGSEVEGFNIALDYMKKLPKPHVFVSDGVRLGQWFLLHTPGHTPGHTTLFREGVAITGDLILQHDTSNVAYIPLQGYRPLSEYLKSLVRVAKLEAEVIIPSHGPLIQDCRRRVGEIFHHHLRRLEQTSRALQKGLTTPTEIAGEVQWSKGRFETLTPLDRWLAILETLSHLDFLEEHGYASAYAPNGYRLSQDADWDRVERGLANIAEGMWKP
ncbi:putative metallo-hydrolase YflN [archaeon HR01]|nr:putative metallo-hydrolase YflN [archaeon HR01]